MRVAPVVDAIADLEGRIENLVRWARAVRDLGGCCHDVSADGLGVIGEAMLVDAVAAKAGWRRCFDLARQGGDPFPAPVGPEDTR